MSLNNTDKILKIYNVLKQQSSLAPSEVVNEAFSNLVNISRENHTDVFSPEVINITSELHKLSAEGEYQLEKHWAQLILASPFPMLKLEEYPYFRNYELLTQLEHQSLKVLGERPVSKVLFIGSGPLPLAAIFLAKQYGIAVTCVDRDVDACVLSEQLIKKLRLENLISIVHSDAVSVMQNKVFDAVFVAALVGTTQEEKLELINKIYNVLRPGSLLIIRTAHGNRRLLYPYLDESQIENFKVHAVIHPMNEVINTVIITEKPLTEDVDIVIKDKTEVKVFNDFVPFAFKSISEQYNIQYNALWHQDINTAEQTYGSEKASLFVAYINGSVAGTVAIRPMEYRHDWQRERYSNQVAGAVWRYFIDLQYTQTSVAQKLHAKLEDFARSAGYTILCAHEQGFVSGSLRKYIDNGYIPIKEDQDQLETIHIEKNL
ncbi:MAG TPA: nicotianamine synthase family protein [Candidatus Doudnabacteria bacterium]|nr:nicotianamine synthase family protein [Candidatus Doudnabacteria bacterium]